MRTAGMLRGTRAICYLPILVFLIGYAHSYPIQILPSIPGYIPVYIRHGDEPLENINPALAEAFHETPSPKSMRLNNVPSAVEGHVEEDALLGKPEENHLLSHVRRSEGGSNKGRESLDEHPKLLPIYELHDEDEKPHRQRHREHSRRKPLSKESTAKLPALYGEHKEDPEKQKMQIAKKETSLNDLEEHAESDLSDTTVEGSNLHEAKDAINKDTTKNEEAPMKIERPSDILANVQKLLPVASAESDSKSTMESSASASATPFVMETEASPKPAEPLKIPTDLHILPTIPLPMYSLSPREKDEVTGEETPLKVPLPAHIIPGLFKLMPDSNPSTADSTPVITKKDELLNVRILPTISSEDSQVSVEKDAATDEEPALKISPPATLLSNVAKLAPTSSLEHSKPSADEVTSSSLTEKETSSQDEAHILSTTSAPNESPQHSKDRDSTSTTDDEPPVKVQHPAGIATNVYKLEPVGSSKEMSDRNSSPKEEITENR